MLATASVRGYSDNVLRSRSLATSSAFAVALTVALWTPGPVRAEEPEIAVSDRQIVTLNGSSPSLRAVIQQLCAESGVELRQYDAEDRAFAGSYDGVSLSELLPRLLRSESYAVGVRASQGEDKPRIAWVRVMGASTGKAPPPMVVTPAAVAAVTPDADDANDEDDEDQSKGHPWSGEEAATIFSSFVDPAFSNVESEERRRQAVETIARDLTTNIHMKEALERADPSLIAHRLAEHPEARGAFAMIQSAVSDPEMQRRLNAIAAALNGELNNRKLPD